MADRELMEINGHDDTESIDGTVETVRGAGRVGVIAAAYEQ